MNLLGGRNGAVPFTSDQILDSSFVVDRVNYLQTLPDYGVLNIDRH